MKYSVVALGVLLAFGRVYGQAGTAGSAAPSPAPNNSPNATSGANQSQPNQSAPGSLLTLNASGNSFATYREAGQTKKDSQVEAPNSTIAQATIAQAVFSFFLVCVGLLQWWVVSRQRDIMTKQTEIFDKQAGIFTQQVEAARAQHSAALEQARVMGNQLIANKAASAASQKTADETIASMKASLQHAEETSIKQLRAYITVQLSAVEPFPFYINVIEGGVFNFNLRVKNSGQTPASEVRYSGGELKVFDFPLSDDWSGINPISHEAGGSNAVFGASDTLDWHVGSGNFTPELDMGEIGIQDPSGKRKRRELFALGRIEYKDIFGKKRFTHFCYVLLPRAGDGALTPRIANKGNETDSEYEYR